MARYIDKEAFKRKLIDEKNFFPAMVARALEEMPTADVVEVKHGEWKWDERFSDYTCSLCHNWDLTTPNYCSNCGAKMDGGMTE